MAIDKDNMDRVLQRKSQFIKPNVFWIAAIATTSLILLAYFGEYLSTLEGDAAVKVAGIVLKTAFVGTIAYASGVLGIGLAAAKVGAIGRLNATLVYLVASSMFVLCLNTWVLRFHLGSFMDSAYEAAIVGIITILVGMIAGYMRDEVETDA